MRSLSARDFQSKVLNASSRPHFFKSFTSTKTGLQVRAVIDENEYEKSRNVSDEEILSLNNSIKFRVITKTCFHGPLTESL